MLTSCITVSQEDQKLEGTKPNILWITIEDTSPQFIGAYGNSTVHTPNIDSLITQGIRFDRAFATSPVCSPTRFSIFTGVNTQLTGTGNHRSEYPIPGFMKGFPAYLRNEGYYTTNNSKTDYNTSDANRLIHESWDESSSEAGWWKRQKNQPFFSVFNFEDSHQSRTMTNPYPWYEKNVLDKLKPGNVTEASEIEVPPFYHDTPQMRKYLVRVHNSINYTDQKIGELLAKLKKDSLLEETIIFFYSDHGQGIPNGKCAPRSLGYRAAFAVWFPEKYKYLAPWKPGTVNKEMVSFEDLAPTIMSLAGLPKKDYMTGRAFLGKNREEAPEFIFTSRDRIDETLALSRSVISEKYIYTKVFLPQYPIVQFQKYADVSDITNLMRADFENGKLDSLQCSLFLQQPGEYLYDLQKDKWEIRNLAGLKEYSDVLEVMRKKLYEHLLQVRDVHFIPEYDTDRIAKITTPYSFRYDSVKYPLQQILDLNFRKKPPSVHELVDLFNDKSLFLNYWAAVNLAFSNGDITPFKGKLTEIMEETGPTVKIELAGILYKKFELPEAKEVLEKFALDNNPFLALQSLHNIQYMGRKTADFEKVLESVLEKNNIQESKYLNIRSIIEVTLHYLNDRALYYDYMKPWLDKTN